MELLHKRIHSGDFVLPIISDSDFICSICTDVLKEPILTVECGHNFCNDCLFPTNSNRVSVCPVDSTPFDEAKVVPDKKTERQILNKEVKCANSPNCSHKGMLNALSEHLKVCLWEVVPCQNGCEEQFVRSDEEKHLGESCVKRKVACPHCSGVFLHTKLVGHINECPCAPVECPNADCKHIARRQDLLCHLKEECAQEVISCPLAMSGCEGQCARGLLQKHFEEKSVFHGKIVHQILQDLKSQSEKQAELLQQQQATHSKQLNDVQTDYDKKIELLKSTHSKQLDEIKTDFDKKIELLKATHSKQLDDIKTDCDKKIEKQSELFQLQQATHSKQLKQSVFTVLEEAGIFLYTKKILPAEWWDKTGPLGGIRKGTHRSKQIYFIVSQSDVWEKGACYVPPDGYQWISTAEYPQDGDSGVHSFFNQGGWTGYNWNGKEKYYFIFKDSHKTNKSKHAGSLENYGFHDAEISKFAGIVCTK